MYNFVRRFSNTLKSYRRFSHNVADKTSPIVATAEGKLRGASDKLYDGSTYYSFKGIPYAEPPIGKLRFKDPIPQNAWIGVRDALEHGPSNFGVDLHSGKIKMGQEDCLYLNIYTPSLEPDSKLPVIVYIHGGAFKSGSGNSSVYGPKFLIKHGVILVTLNYRLEAFGFLCLDSPEVPGNAGIKDQVVALRWIQRNITNFGGDCNNVTIFGESAGGVSVTYHLLSPLTDGLFHKAVAQSSTFLLDWAIDTDAKGRALRAGKFLGNETKNSSELLKFLQAVPAKDLVNITIKSSSRDENFRGAPIRFTPVVEKFKNEKTFLDTDPLHLIRSGQVKKVPTIVGYNVNDGLILSKIYLERNLEIYNKEPFYYVPKEIVDKISHEKMIELGKRIKKFYFADKDISPDDVDLLSILLSDINAINGVYRFADLYSEINSPTYMYRFNCVTELNYMKYVMGYSKAQGSCHGDQIFYTFDNPVNKELYEKYGRLRNLVEKITKLWANFAKTGNPTPDDSLGAKWLPYTKSNRQYLRIEEKLLMGSNAEQERLEFWRKIFKEAGL